MTTTTARHATAGAIVLLAFLGQWAGSYGAAMYVCGVMPGGCYGSDIGSILATGAGIAVFFASTMIGVAAYNWGNGKRWDSVP